MSKINFWLYLMVLIHNIINSVVAWYFERQHAELEKRAWINIWMMFVWIIFIVLLLQYR